MEHKINLAKENILIRELAISSTNVNCQSHICGKRGETSDTGPKGHRIVCHNDV